MQREPLKINAFQQAFLKSAWIDSAIEGINAAGDKCSIVQGLNDPCDLAMHTSGVKAIQGPLIDARKFLIKKYGWKRVIVESRVFRQNSAGGEEKYWRLSIGGFLEDEAIYHPPGFEADESRWNMIRKEQSIELRPWRENGSHVLLCAQKPSDASLRGKVVDEWCNETIDELRNYTDRTIIVRPHPLDHGGVSRLENSIRIRPGVNVSKTPVIAGDLKNAWAVVAYTSLSVIEAACEGVPIFVTDTGSPAWSVANTDLSKIESPVTFDREPWLWDLSYRQWKVSELKTGKPWARLREAYYERCRNGL